MHADAHRVYSGSAILQGQGNEKGGDDYTGPYNVAMHWPKPSRLAGPGRIFGSTSGIWAESADQFSADPDGNLYVAEVFGGRAQKFTPRPGADQAKIFKKLDFKLDFEMTVRLGYHLPHVREGLVAEGRKR